ncbi:MAG: septum formation protein Maf [Clostridia bacterium]|nr:septum formation protein Maf [Clostridia bacterium]
MKIILASKSPRRKEILNGLGFDFEIHTADTNESCDVTDPESLVQILAVRKGSEVLKNFNDNDTLIISCDTIVCCDDKVLGKPKSYDDAVGMLKSLSGRKHTVMSGLALFLNGKTISGCEKTDVYFAPMPDSFIEAYVSTGDTMDKAGGYAVQGRTALYIEKLDGCYFNVVGLPVRLLTKLLEQLGLDPTELIIRGK